LFGYMKASKYWS